MPHQLCAICPRISNRQSDPSVSLRKSDRLRIPGKSVGQRSIQPTMDAIESQSALAPEDAASLMRLATYSAVSVAVVLISAKAMAWLYSDSLSLLATLVDSCMDALASMINLLAVRKALSPADAEHRFGHGKFEPLAGLGQAAFVAGSAVFLVVEGIRRIITPQPLEAFSLGIGVMLFAMAATSALLLFQRHVVRRTGSLAIHADSLHYRTDLIVSASVIVSLVLAAFGWEGFDALFAMAIALYIFYSAWSIAKQSLDQLLDRELPDAQREDIIRLTLEHGLVRGMHDLRTRRAGITAFMELHIELDDDLSLLQAHQVGVEVKAKLQEQFRPAEILVHIDPASVARDLPARDFPL